MHITLLQLKTFRNYQLLELPLGSHSCIFTGENGQGKTNLLEAISLVSTGRSHRTNREKDMIMHGEPFARVRCETQQRDGKHTVDVVLSRNEKKRVQVNGLPISRIGDMLGHIKSVMFSPEDLNLIKDGPTQRRRFMDMYLSQVSRVYFYALAQYLKTLQQRNNLLKALNHGAKYDGTLEIWDEMLIKHGIPVLVERYKLIHRLSPICSKIHGELSGGKEELTLCYNTGVSGKNKEDLIQCYRKSLAQNQEKDIKLGNTSVGPHKDDLGLRLGDTDLRYFGSQGQQRTAALALKLSELDLMKEDIGQYPVLLLDDVLSELDESRQRQLLTRIENVQTFITATHIDKALTKSIQAQQFNVNNGKVTKLK